MPSQICQSTRYHTIKTRKQPSPSRTKGREVKCANVLSSCSLSIKHHRMRRHAPARETGKFGIGRQGMIHSWLRELEYRQSMANYPLSTPSLYIRPHNIGTLAARASTQYSRARGVKCTNLMWTDVGMTWLSSSMASLSHNRQPPLTLRPPRTHL